MQMNIPQMNETVRELCSKLIREKQWRENPPGQRKRRTVRNTIITDDSSPMVIKSVVDVRPQLAKDETNSGSKRFETSLDYIIRQLQRGKWPPDVVVLITPASKHNNLYKLHVIDRNNNGHLGMTSITQQELAELRESNVFEKYATIVGNKYIDLKTVTLNTAIIANIIKNLNGDCCQQPLLELPLPVSLDKHETNKLVARKNGSDPDLPMNLQLEPSQKRRHICQYHTESGMRLVTLIDRINDAIEPSDKDLLNFFDLAEIYKFKMYIRPELCWKPPPQAALLQNSKDTDYVRFNIECFMLFDNYVGSIAINSLQLHEQLKIHPSLFQRIQVIEDVFEITPLPNWLVTILRRISEWFGLEMFYDAFGEFIFDLYKQVT